MSYKEDTKRFNSYSKGKLHCKCGHSLIIPVYKDFCICSYCGAKVINNTKEHFKYKMRRMLNDK